MCHQYFRKKEADFYNKSRNSSGHPRVAEWLNCFSGTDVYLYFYHVSSCP
jgi:hypothetical protein